MNPMVMLLVAETHLHLPAARCSTPMLTRFTRENQTPWPALASADLAQSLAKLDATLTPPHVLDAKLLLLPVRSLDGTYKWLTCRPVFERFVIDAFAVADAETCGDVKGSTESAYDSEDSHTAYLEERIMESVKSPKLDLLRCLRNAMQGHPAAERLDAQLHILDEKDFGWFCAYALPKHGRTRLTPDRTMQHAWFEEVVPADAIFYTMADSEEGNLMTHWRSRLGENPYLQIGRNRSVGQGWLWARCLPTARELSPPGKPV